MDKAYPGSKQIPIPPLKNIHPTRPPIEQAIIFADCVRSVLAPLAVTALGYAELAQELEDLPMLDADEVMAKCRSGGSLALRKATVAPVEAIFKKYGPTLPRSAEPAFSQTMLDEVEADRARLFAEIEDMQALIESIYPPNEPTNKRKLELLGAQIRALFNQDKQLLAKHKELLERRESHTRGSAQAARDDNAFNAYQSINISVVHALRLLFGRIQTTIRNEDENALIQERVDFDLMCEGMVKVAVKAARHDAEATWDVVNQTLEQL